MATPASLREYAQHKRGCDKRLTMRESETNRGFFFRLTKAEREGMRCTCGLDEVLALLDVPVEVEIIVNGQPVTVPAGPIRAAIAAAIQKAGQIGAPIDQWILRTREGDIIPHQLPDGEEYALAGGQRLFLHLGLPTVRDVLVVDQKCDRCGSRLVPSCPECS